jgi:hypothetical protein
VKYLVYSEADVKDYYITTAGCLNSGIDGVGDKVHWALEKAMEIAAEVFVRLCLHNDVMSLSLSELKFERVGWLAEGCATFRNRRSGI